MHNIANMRYLGRWRTPEAPEVPAGPPKLQRRNPCVVVTPSGGRHLYYRTGAAARRAPVSVRRATLCVLFAAVLSAFSAGMVCLAWDCMVAQSESCFVIFDDFERGVAFIGRLVGKIAR